MTDKMGIIKAIVQGARKNKSRFFSHFELGNCLEIVLAKKDTANLHKIIDSTIISGTDCQYSYQQLLSLQIVLETYYQLIITDEESETFYQLLLSFVEYLPTVKNNYLLVCWRFLLRLSDCLGFPLVSFNNHRFEFTDPEVLHQQYDDDFLKTIRDWLNILPSTGKYINEPNILNKSCSRMNKLIFDWFHNHLNQKLHHKALAMYEETIE
jgi:hypothetical protein